MPKGEKWAVFLGAASFVLLAIQTWILVLHEAEHRVGIMSIVFIILFSVVVEALIVWAVYRNLKDANRCETLQAKLEAERKERQFVGGEVALLSFFQEWTAELISQLEQLWYHWNAVGETLVHPISMTCQDWKSWSSPDASRLISERRDFTVLYAYHIAWIARQLAKFESETTRTGYPSEKEYPQVLRDLKEHAELLGKLCDEVWHSGKSAVL